MDRVIGKGDPTAYRFREKYLLAAQAAYGAEPLLRPTAQTMPVLGGLTGPTPYPAARQLGSLVSAHRLRYAYGWNFGARNALVPPALSGRTRMSMPMSQTCGRQYVDRLEIPPPSGGQGSTSPEGSGDQAAGS
ncbi:hypothetical protein ACWGCW_38380 [Streptomyces sp. NPDC054933]